MVNNSLRSLFDPAIAALVAPTDKAQIFAAITLSHLVMSHLGIECESPEELSYGILALPNSERFDHWFRPHPSYASDRACYEITPKNSLNIEAKLYCLSKKSRLSIAWAVSFTPNWEDSDGTRASASRRMGIDFFLTPESSLLVVLSDKWKLRLMELTGHLSNTQVDILTSWKDAAILPSKEAIHTTLWRSLAVSSVNALFYDGIATSFMDLVQHLDAQWKDHELSKVFASRLHGRLLFVWFLRKKGIIWDGGEYFDLGDFTESQYYQSKLATLFFGCFNTPIPERTHLDRITPYLNGGLFDSASDGTFFTPESLSFPTGWFHRLFAHLESFNFTTDESTPEYEQVAIDPEMLGRIFENLLATQIEATGEQARKAKGAFYTPREIVSYMCAESLRTALKTHSTLPPEKIDRLIDTSPSEWANAGTNSRRDNYSLDERKELSSALARLTILDPACGSGAFPMGILQGMMTLYERIETKFDPYDKKLQIIQNNIYGVDIEPMAVEIARLRAWLSLIVEVTDKAKVAPLPNLDFKFVCANSLIPLASSQQLTLVGANTLHSDLATIRAEYYQVSDKSRKIALQRKYESLISEDALDLDSVHSQQLKGYHAFDTSVSATFYDPSLMHGVSSGFDIVIGNPPYVQLQKFARTQTQKDLESQKYKTFDKRGDIYALFYERGIEMSKKETGILCYITSNKWMRAGYGEKLREYFTSKDLRVLIDMWPGVFESATVDTNILIIMNARTVSCINEDGSPQVIGVRCEKALTLKAGDRDSLARAVAERGITLHGLTSWPWFLGSPYEVALKAKIESIGTPLKDWDVSIYRGILTWLNEAFIIDTPTRDRLIAEDPNSEKILKPLLRGRDIQRYGYEWGGLWVIIVKYWFAKELEKYPAIFNHLKSYEEKLRMRGQCNTSRTGKVSAGALGETGQHHWLELDNNPTNEYLAQFEKEKVVWGQFQDWSEYSLSWPWYYLSSNEYMLSGEYSRKYILWFLNSRITKWYLDTIANSLGWNASIFQKSVFVELPIPLPTTTNAHIIAAIEERVERRLALVRHPPVKTGDPERSQSNGDILESEVDELVYELYGLTEEEIKIVEGK